MRPSLRFVPLVFATLAACTVYAVPDDTDGTGSGGSTTAVDPTSTGGTPTSTGEPDPTSTSTTTTTTDPTVGPSSDPSGPTSDPTTGDPPPADCDFPTSIQPIFAGCGCHNNDTPPKGLGLGDGVSYANLVDVDSVGQPGTPRVAPGNAAGSWLVTKLNPMPPVGLQMPEGGMLAPDKLALIETWINAGAPEAAPFACDGGGGGGAGSVSIDEQGPVQVEIGETLDLDATVLDEQGIAVMGATVTWAASDETIVYVDGKGTLLGLLPGQVQVTAAVDGVVSDPITVQVELNQAVAASFNDVLGVLTTSCGCHSGAMPPAGLAFDLDAAGVHAALLAPATQDAQAKRILPDAPGQSYLFKKLTRTVQTTGEQMPKGKGPLDAEKVAPLFRWISNGAPL